MLFVKTERYGNNNRKIVSIFFIVILSFLVVELDAEQVSIKNANELVGVNTENANIRTLLGNVHIQQKNVDVYSEKATQNINSNIFHLSGKARLTQNDIVLKADDITYDGNTGIAVGKGNISIIDKTRRIIYGNNATYDTKIMQAHFTNDVVLQDSQQTLTAIQLVYNRKEQQTIAIDSVCVINTARNRILHCDTLIDDAVRKTQQAVGNVALSLLDSSDVNKIDTTLLFATLLLNDVTGKIYYAYEDVYIQNATMKALADTLIYDENMDTLSMRAKNRSVQVMLNDWTSIIADRMFLKLDSMRLRNTVAIGNALTAFIDSLRPEKVNQLVGDTIYFYTDNDTLQKIESIGTAKAISFITKEQQPDGLLTLSANKIFIDCEENKPSMITATAPEPGKYIPEPLVYGKEKDFYFRTDFLNVPEIMKERFNKTKPTQ